jgi:hypothetical protein
LKQRIIAGLRGPPADDSDTKDPSAASKDAWEYRKSIPTMVLYDEKGLRLYDAITEDAPEYYLFGAELGLFKEHGGEIARAMGFPQRVEQRQRKEQDGPEDEGRHVHEGKPADKVDERWGDVQVGKWNDGVNGENGVSVDARNVDATTGDDGQGSEDDMKKIEQGWDIVELGAGLVASSFRLWPDVSNLAPDHLPTPPFDHAFLVCYPSRPLRPIVPCARHRCS